MESLPQPEHVNGVPWSMPGCGAGSGDGERFFRMGTLEYQPGDSYFQRRFSASRKVGAGAGFTIRSWGFSVRGVEHSSQSFRRPRRM